MHSTVKVLLSHGVLFIFWILKRGLIERGFLEKGLIRALRYFISTIFFIFSHGIKRLCTVPLEIHGQATDCRTIFVILPLVFQKSSSIYWIFCKRAVTAT